MNRPIRTETEHAEAVAEIRRLWGAEEGTAEGDRLALLIVLVNAYEDEHHQIDPPDLLSNPKNTERLLRSVAQFDATDSRILSEVHEAAKDLHEAGAIDEQTMRRFDRQMEAAGKIMREDRNVLRNLSDQPIQLPASDHYTYRVSWSPEDGEYVATCAEFPSLSWLDKDEVAALTGLCRLINEVVSDLSDEPQHRPHSPQ